MYLLCNCHLDYIYSFDLTSWFYSQIQQQFYPPDVFVLYLHSYISSFNIFSFKYHSTVTPISSISLNIFTNVCLMIISRFTKLFHILQTQFVLYYNFLEKDILSNVSLYLLLFTNNLSISGLDCFQKFNCWLCCVKKFYFILVFVMQKCTQVRELQVEYLLRVCSDFSEQVFSCF